MVSCEQGMAAFVCRLRLFSAVADVLCNNLFNPILQFVLFCISLRGFLEHVGRLYLS